MEHTLYRLLKHHDLKLLLAKDTLICRDEFDGNFDGWQIVSGDWHVMTDKTNVDLSLGLDGEKVAISTMGCWVGGKIEKEIYLENYGEITFEHYVQNNSFREIKVRQPNYLRFYVDGQMKLEVKGPSPWYRCEPIGLTPGKHLLEFEYVLPPQGSEDSEPYERKAVFDTVIITQSRDVNCIISDYTPPYPVKNVTKTQILRGFSTFAEMLESDTQIEFMARFEGIDFHDFIIHASDIFYFVDEFGVCYRGLFEGDMLPKVVALKKQYVVELSMLATSKAGVGFC